MEVGLPFFCQMKKVSVNYFLETLCFNYHVNAFKVLRLGLYLEPETLTLELFTGVYEMSRRVLVNMTRC